jgi:hypothetical protein
MKNIHILPTENPSSLFEIDGHLIINKEQLIQPKYYRNIYITSDEEIKEGDWVLGDYPDNPICKVIAKYGQEFTAQSLNGDKYGLAEYDSKKIILTTDQDLIKDGVQTIDDEFLEWFVKNPSCESVETHIVKLCTNCGQQFCDNRDCLGYKDEPEYLISFPENTIKQIITYCKGYEISRENIIIPKEEPKQETLEEASETAWNLYEHVEGNLYSTSFKNGFKLGAEWLQDKKMYSEEDMKSFGDWCRNALLNTEYSFEKLDEHLKTWEQIRNK